MLTENQLPLRLIPLVGLMGATLAQTGTHTEEWQTTGIDLSYPSMSNSVDVARLEGGDVNLSGVPDLVMLQDGVLMIGIDPSWAESLVVALGTHNDMVVVPSNTNRPVDTIYTLTAGGVERIGFTKSGHFLLASGTVLDSTLQAATKLRRGDVTLSGFDDLLVADALKRDIWVLAESAGEYYKEANYRARTDGDIDDFVLCRFDPALPPYIVASTTDGLEIFDLAGQSVQKLSTSVPRNGSLAVLDVGVLGAQRVAWLRDRNNGRKFSVVDQSFTEVSILNFGSGVRTLAALDVDLDGLSDVVTSRLNGRKLRVHYNDGGVFHASGPETETVTVATTPQAQECVPFVGDFDHDQDIDLAIVVPGEQRLFMGFNDRVERSVTAPQILETGANNYPHRWLYLGGSTNALTYETTLRVDRSLAVPSGAGAVEAMMWRTIKDTTTGKYATLPVPEGRQLVMLTAPTWDPVNMVWYNEFPFTAFDPVSIDNSLVFTTVRYVALHSDLHSVRKGWPVTQHCIVGRHNAHAKAYAVSIPFVDVLSPLYDNDPFLLPGEGTGGESSENSKSDCCPGFEDGCAPDSDG